MSEPRPEPPAGGGRVAQLAGLAISAVCLVGVVWWASRQHAPRLPGGAGELAALAVSVALYAVAMLVRGERWWRLLVRGGGAPSRTDAYALTAVGYMGNNVLPARGGDAMRVYLGAPRARSSYREVIGTLIAERLLDAAVLLGLFAVLAYLVLDEIEAPGGGRVAVVAITAVALAGATALALYAARDRPRVRRLIGFASPMTRATRELRGPHGAEMVGFTAAIWTLEAATYWAAGAAVGLEMTALEALYVVALASVFVLIPSGPGYLGTLDAAILFGARAIGAGGGAAVSYLLILRFVLLVPVTLVGLALLLGRYGGRRSLRQAELETGDV